MSSLLYVQFISNYDDSFNQEHEISFVRPTSNINLMSSYDIIDYSFDNILSFENVSLLQENGFSSGSILGVSNDQQFLEIQDSNTAIGSGSILGISDMFVVQETYDDDKSTNQISAEHPSPLQGNSIVDINKSFEKPEKPIVEIVKSENVRDMSRFRKCYSFTRFKPVRFRTTKRA
jgi:hypothetical protein